ncbi:hypothetical protein [Nitratidesulfovibrio vulgaris]|uniref:Uncharacterized protein n=1 Tax=Nitratidesulfovibrio vulgaris (strain DP4) TaxID=391774 RepID=A0A0H3AAS8_NITV4|nr:hypothetical protein [Nitratidesulfovibrio vulgaris]ABM28698.1 conserved hypothetical protein [Nitratidesulfovibrio vulgaris DP4]GEB79128.1 hypothetical protein DDE01_05430 [Desulfovibrio desulfuricans]HBW15825.1 hypothetical protein [Desulfovibrio sp.]
MEILSYILSITGMVLTAGAVFNLVLHRKGHPTAIWRSRKMIIGGIACLIVVSLLPVERQPMPAAQPQTEAPAPSIPLQTRESVLKAVASIEHVANVTWSAPQQGPLELSVSSKTDVADASGMAERICRELAAHGLSGTAVTITDAKGTAERNVCR